MLTTLLLLSLPLSYFAGRLHARITRQQLLRLRAEQAGLRQQLQSAQDSNAALTFRLYTRQFGCRDEEGVRRLH